MDFAQIAWPDRRQASDIDLLIGAKAHAPSIGKLITKSSRKLTPPLPKSGHLA
jgi:hypothetical protein